VTETCADDGPNVITDVATVPAASAGTADPAAPSSPESPTLRACRDVYR
jgi:hypothetical protein